MKIELVENEEFFVDFCGSDCEVRIYNSMDGVSIKVFQPITAWKEVFYKSKIESENDDEEEVKAVPLAKENSVGSNKSNQCGKPVGAVNVCVRQKGHKGKHRDSFGNTKKDLKKG